MEVMAEANEQPALLNQRLDEGKKNRRPRNAAGARKRSTAKSGARRTRQPSKEQEFQSAENKNSSGQDAPEEQPDTNSQISLPLSAPGETIAEGDVSADDRDRSNSNETAEE